MFITVIKVRPVVFMIVISLLRCFMGTTSLMLSFYAFRHMPLVDASFSFLKEQFSIFNVIAIVLTLVGVVLITRPPFIFGETSPSALESERYVGPVAAISSTLFGANVYLLLRALKGLHFSVIMTNFGAFALIYTLIVCGSIGVICWPACGHDRWFVVGLGIFSFLGQILLILSLQMEQAGPKARCADIFCIYMANYIHRLRNKPVSWVRLRDGHIISVDQTTFIADQRFQAIYQNDNDCWKSG
uniref:EamA domain-containing protein n=1 Tax=Glossina brevipalpis TaxID=37001 RepID=A0A1A9WQY8_9MUSC